MSYPVTVPHGTNATHWFPNAMKNAWVKHKPDMSEKKEYNLSDCWALEYDNTAELDDTGRWVVLFPSEQDYVMFLLRWL